tara:strand:+ start:511 stop:1767 length:1257 start_codon:yes stop_codon:yes gene_type:complete
MSLTLHKATHAITGMAKINYNTNLTKDEALELWSFLNEPVKLPMSRSSLKMLLAKECGVFIEQLDSVMGKASLAQTLVWESSRSEGNELTLQEVKSIIQSPPQEDWIIALCRKMNTTEAEFVWRWALDERWRSIKNRMEKWAYQLLHESEFGKSENNLKIIDYNRKLSVPQIIQYLKTGKNNGPPLNTLFKATQFLGLKKWIGTHLLPDKWWLVKDGGNLRHVDTNGVVRFRNGDLDVNSTMENEYTDECWTFETFNNIISNTLVDDIQNVSWSECVNLIHHHPKACILIYDDSRYFILSSGTVSLYTQLLTIRNIRNGGYELLIGFRDGFDIVDVDTIFIDTLPFELEQALKSRQVNYHNNHQVHDIPDGMVIMVDQSWHPNRGWYLRYIEYCPMKGLSDVDEIVDYYALVKYDEEE